MKPIGWGAAVWALILVAATFTISYLWLSSPIPYLDTSDSTVLMELVRMEAAARRNALATAGGIAALGALLLAFRRQRHTEHQ
jgi:hypothetical protein